MPVGKAVSEDPRPARPSHLEPKISAVAVKTFLAAFQGKRGQLSARRYLGEYFGVNDLAQKLDITTAG